MTPMEHALEDARAAAQRGEVPVGAVITDPLGKIIARGGNAVETMRDPSAHAEMRVLRAAASALGEKYLTGCTLTVTLEPCAMCAGAISAFRVSHLVFGAYDAKTGAVEHGPRVLSHASTHFKPQIIGGVRESECSAILSEFFGGLRHA